MDRVTYHDERTLYTVLRVVPEPGSYVPESGSLFETQRVTAVGKADNLGEGARVRLTGSWTKHRTHGHQFEFESAQPMAPTGRKGLVRYLSGKSFPGIGPTTAERIVDALGEQALEIIRERPEELKQVKGLKPAQREMLRETVAQELALHETLAFLLGLGLGPVQTRAVVKKLGPEAESLVRQDPWRLATVEGIGFATADKAALAMDFERDDRRRVRAGLLHGLKRESSDGHSLVFFGRLVELARGLLQESLARGAFESALADLVDQDHVVLERDHTAGAGADPQANEASYPDDLAVYLPYLHTSECGVTQSLAGLLDCQVAHLADVSALAKGEKAAGIDLDPGQRDAVALLLSHPVALLTGGPGVGKTTIIRFVANLAELGGAEIALASPTGRAAKRLAEATGRPAKTIHRLLGYNAEEGGFEHNREKPIEAGLLIVDEISMLDVALAHHLLKAVEKGTRLVLVGDPDQLPSVGAGNVLADLLQSACVPTARLTTIFRQDGASLIVANAHRILEGDDLVYPERGDRDSDFYLFPQEDAAQGLDLLVDVITKRIPENFGFDWVRDVQVIAPMYKGDLGVDSINDALREAHGIGGREVVRGSSRWRMGDRVIHTRNDYEKKVFNGDMGHITQISGDGLVTVAYPEQDVVYEGSELSDLRPAFAITVHRSQGGEFPVVVIPLATAHRVMLQRNLLYTAVTRAKKLVVLVGSRRALRWAIDNQRQNLRASLLSERIVAAAPAGSNGGTA
ncbi:MAG: exodeoxyribonuclease V alpha subunit [Planctomycetota bacterium]